MKLKIKNYRTLKNVEFSICKNKINYLLGGNESGKSNLLNALRIPDLKNQINFSISKQDKTIFDGERVKENISVIVEEEKAINHFGSQANLSTFWFYVESDAQKEYLEIIEKEFNPKFKNWCKDMASKRDKTFEADEKNIYDNIIDVLTTLHKVKYIDLERMFYSYEKEFQLLKNRKAFNDNRIRKHELTKRQELLMQSLKSFKNLDKHRRMDDEINLNMIPEYNFSSRESFMNFSIKRENIIFKLPGFKEIHLKLLKSLNSMKIQYPHVHYIEPILMAKKNGIIEYEYDSLFEESSTLNNLCLKFLDDKTIFKLQTMDEAFEQIEDRRRYIRFIFEKLNSEVKKYFDKFEHISAYPRFFAEESKVFLEVISKKEWKIDNRDENERSLGYKSFLRIITELIAINPNKKTLYIIDEPEQSLHPFLQNELSTQMAEIIKEKNNLTILLVTHSPYIIKESYNFEHVSFITRDETGASKVKTMNEIKNFHEVIKQFVENKKTETSYLLKILIDSNGWKKQLEKIEEKIDKLQAQLDAGEITTDEFLKWTIYYTVSQEHMLLDVQ